METEAMSPQQTEELREAFALFDKDGDGSITCEELVTVMTSMRQYATQDEIREMIEQVDVDGKGHVSFEDFLELMVSTRRQRSAHQEMREYFRVFDKDGDGFINAQDISETMKTLGEHLSDEDVAHMVREADTDKDGRINFEEFINMMRHRMQGAFVVDEPLKDKYSAGEYSDLRLAFSLFDKNHDGSISLDEMKSVMFGVGQGSSDEDLERMFRDADLDGNGQIDFSEFVEMMEQRMERKSEEAEMRSLFLALDRDNNGYIDSGELKNTLQQLGMEVTNKDIADMMQEVGVAISGRIYYEDFLHMMMGDIGRAHRHVIESQRLESEADALRAVRTPSMDESQKHDQRLAFAMFDTDGDGTLSKDEVLGAMNRLELNVSTDRLDSLFNKADLDGNGQIDFSEFSQLLYIRQTDLQVALESLGGGTDQERRLIFGFFDKDRDGIVTVGDLRCTMEELGISPSDDDLKAMMSLISIDVNGKIGYEDFCRLFFGQNSSLLSKRSPPKSVSENNNNKTITEESYGSFTSDEIKEMRVVFSSFDKDGDGSISLDEVRQVMSRLGRTAEEDKLAASFRQIDLDGNGSIDFREFLQLVDKRLVKEPMTVDTRELFAAFDHDSSGFIDRDELQSTMRDLGMALTDEELSDMLAEAGTQDSKISYEDFVRIVSGKAAPKHEPVVFESVQVESMQEEQKSRSGSSGESQSSASVYTSESDIETSEVVSAFSLIDKEGTGFITTTQLHNVMNVLGIKSDRKFVEEMIEKFDQRGDGQVCFEDFLSMMQSRNSEGKSRWQRTKKKHEQPDCWKAFKYFDKNHDGYISVAELRQTMSELGVNLTEVEVTEMMSQADINQDGRIDYKEFKLLHNTGMEPFIDEAMKNRESLYEKTIQKAFTEEELRVAFSAFDKHGNGRIEASDLALVMRSLGMTYSAKELSRMLKRFSSQGNGTIDFMEFLSMMERSRSRHEQSEDDKRASEEAVMRQAFRVFDLDNDGLIDAHELKHTMHNLGEDLSDSDVMAMITAADKNGDGKIDYQEFIKMMYNK